MRRVNKLAFIIALWFVTTSLLCACETGEQAGKFVEYSKPLAMKSGTTEVNDLEIDGLDAPAVGQPFDMTAVVKTAEGVTWTIPVIWVDEDGNVAKIAEKGKSYRPTIVFFAPMGVKIARAEGKKHFDIKLPAFLKARYGKDSFVFVDDENGDVTYIVSVPNTLKRSGTKRTATRKNAPNTAARTANPPVPVEGVLPGLPVPGVIPTEVTPQGTAVMPTNTSSQDSGSSDGASSGETSSGEGQPSQPDQPVEPQSEVPEIVRLHCDPAAIDELGVELLEYIVRLIKYTIVPQASELLRNSFPAFYNAYIEELGESLGLYVYYKNGTYGDNIKAGNDALGFVDGQYVNDEFVYLMGINASYICKYIPETDEYEFDTNERSVLDNTIVHELMHAYMDDYVRTGMSGRWNGYVEDYDNWLDTIGAEATDQKLKQEFARRDFPRWFVEGTASCVENVYQFRDVYFDVLPTTNAEALINAYKKSYDSLNPGKISTFLLTDAKREEANYDFTASAYVSGYLAVVYLSHLAQKQATGADDLTAENIRNGFSVLLERLHKGETLDGIIADITYDADSDTSLFTSTEDFQNKFIQNDDDSAQFVLSYLTLMEEITKENGKRANGSILDDFYTDYETMIDPNDDTVSAVFFKIADEKDFVLSTAEDEGALNSGGTSANGAAGSPLPVVAAGGGTGGTEDENGGTEGGSTDGSDERTGLLAARSRSTGRAAGPATLTETERTAAGTAAVPVTEAAEGAPAEAPVGAAAVPETEMTGGAQSETVVAPETVSPTVEAAAETEQTAAGTAAVPGSETAEGAPVEAPAETEQTADETAAVPEKEDGDSSN